MSRINSIQQAIMQLDGGEYQKLMDAYLYKKFKYKNIHPLGSHTGTNKVTRGIPDSFVKLDNGKYVLIMYGTVESTSYQKIEKDIKSCLDKDKINIDIKEIEEIICCYTSTNIHIEQQKELENIHKDIKITLIGIGSVSHDLLIKYPSIASEFLNIPIDTEQIFEIDDFINRYDKNEMNAPINMELLHRENEIESLINKLKKNKVVLIFGKSGIGKTRLALQIAKIYRDNNVNVFCIKNNGQILYNDLKYYLSDSGEYLLFIDDSNEITKLEHVLDYVITPPEGINVKIIMTVRDYAKDRVKQIICEKITPEEEEIDILSDDIIKEILSNNLGIKNNKYLERITEISKGNARLAILAGKIAVRDGLMSIYNSVDIFKFYYGNIIKRESFDKKKIIVAFIITLLGPLEYENNEIVIDILKDNDINKDEFYKLCYELNSNEVVDLFMNKVVKISDQSMGDYLLYHILIEKKYIELSYVIKKLFKNYKRKLVYALNTIMELFNSEECSRYIKEQVNNVWDNIEYREEFEYLKLFHVFNEERSLAYIKRKIDEIYEDTTTIYNFNLKNEKNHNFIESEIIKVLGEFKNSSNYELVLELIIYYFKKKPSEAFDFYLLFSDRLGYDENSFDFEYKKELLNIEYLWKESDKGLDINVSVLLLNIIENYIKFEFRIIKINGKNLCNFSTFNLCMCEGLEKLRKAIWSILGELYNQEKYKNYIHKILLNYNPNSRNKEQLNLIYKIDFKYIKEYIFDRIILPDFMQCKILMHFNEINKRLNIIDDTMLERCKRNIDFSIYNTLVNSNEISSDWRHEEENRKKDIYNMVKNYEEEDFIKLFNLCNNILNKDGNRESYKIRSGIELLFDGIKENLEKLIIAVKAYLKCDVPISDFLSKKIVPIVNNFIGIEETKKIIFNYEYKQKNSWIYEFLFCIPIEKRNLEYANLLRRTFEDEIKKDQPIIPNFQLIALYRDIDENIVCDLASKILEINLSSKPYIIQFFLEYSLDNNSVNMILDIFEEDMNILENLYLSAIEGEIDYEGQLFISLIENNTNFLKKFIKKMININNVSHGMNCNIDKLIRLWEQENYDELIKIYFDTIISYKDNISLFMYESNIKDVFISSANTSKIINDRKIKWIKNYIERFSDNTEHLNLIFQVVMSTLGDYTEELILYFININKNIEIFKSIELFPRSRSWSGSEVNLIEKDINFLNKLIDGVKGIDYIGHKAYLKDIVSKKENYKQQVLVREYLEDTNL